MANGYATGYGLNNRFPTPDADAQVFIDAAGITDTTQVSALHTLVAELKGYGLWQKFHAIYPFVGGTAGAHSYNLVNPATYQIVWSTSGVTHNANGITGNGSTGYGDTQYIIPSARQNDFHISVYVRNNVDSKCAIGCLNNGNAVFTQIYPRVTNLFEGDIHQNVSTTVSNNNSQGLYVASRILASTVKGYKNNGEIISSNTVSLATPNTPLYLLARRGLVIQDYSLFNLGLASIGLGITAVEADTFYTIIQQFQIRLGRQV